MHIKIHINASKVCFSAGDSCFMALSGNILPSAPLLFCGTESLLYTEGCLERMGYSQKSALGWDSHLTLGGIQ